MLSKIVIIEDELFVVLHLSKLIKSLGYKVVGTFHSAEDFLAETDWNFDLALVDIFLASKLTGIDAAKVLSEKQKPFIFLTANQDTKTIHKAAKLAPEAYLSKPFQAAEIEAALTILKLRKKISIESSFYLFLEDNDYTASALTLREVDVLKSLVLDFSNAAIAKKLFISENTVKTHSRNLCKKFNVFSKAELIKKIKKIFKIA
jgi:DNA-binding NarL/FixJ family response regulator